MSSSATEFYAAPRLEGWVVAIVLPLGLMFLLISIRNADLLSMALSIGMLLEAAFFAVPFFRWRTPVVAISGNSLEFGSPYLFRRHGSVLLSEITDVEVRRRAIDLVTPSGRITVSLWDLTEDQQRAVAEAVRQHMGDASRQMG